MHQAFKKQNHWGLFHKAAADGATEIPKSVG